MTNYDRDHHDVCMILFIKKIKQKTINKMAICYLATVFEKLVSLLASYNFC